MIRKDKLYGLLGTWQGQERLEATAWTPAGSATGTFQIAISAEALIIDYQETRAGVTAVSGHGVATESGWWWFDSYGFEPHQPGIARWDGDTLHLDRASERGLTVMRLQRQGPDLVCHMLTAVPADTELTRMLTGQYTLTAPS